MSNQQYREKCLREKEEKCHICGVNENIVVHHIDGNATNDEIGNLLPLCEKCHKKVHGDSAVSYSTKIEDLRGKLGEKPYKRVQERFTQEEFEALKDAKGERSWRDAMLEDIAGVDIDE